MRRVRVHFATIGVLRDIDLTQSGERNAQIDERRPVPRSMETSVRMIATAVQDRRRLSREGLRRLVDAEPDVDAIRDEAVVTDLGSFEAPSGEVTPLLALTERERQVLRLVGTGSTTREISGRLGISTKTVENHKHRIFAKLGVHNQAHAVSIAVRTGLI